MLRHDGTDVNAFRGSKDGYTALHAAVEERQVGAVELLLAAGANLLLKTFSGKTALDLALEERGIARKGSTKQETTRPKQTSGELKNITVGRTRDGSHYYPMYPIDAKQEKKAEAKVVKLLKTAVGDRT